MKPGGDDVEVDGRLLALESLKKGDVLCGEQLDSAEFTLTYNRAWAFAAPDRLRVEGGRYCAEVDAAAESGSGWIPFRFRVFGATIPPFRAAGLPAFVTGRNEVVMDRIPSRGRIHVATGTVLAEVRALLFNSLFQSTFPVPIRVGLRGTYRSGVLHVERLRIESMTPPDYTGPLPAE